MNGLKCYIYIYTHTHTHTHTHMHIHIFIYEKNGHTLEYYSVLEKENAGICDNVNVRRGQYGKWKNTEKEKETLHDLTSM